MKKQSNKEKHDISVLSYSVVVSGYDSHLKVITGNIVTITF